MQIFKDKSTFTNANQLVFALASQAPHSPYWNVYTQKITYVPKVAMDERIWK